jgi:hypothetical protein
VTVTAIPKNAINEVRVMSRRKWRLTQKWPFPPSIEIWRIPDFENAAPQIFVTGACFWTLGQTPTSCFWTLG